MRLFLSSQDLGNHADMALKMARSNTKLAFIRNAQDDKPAEERNFSTPEKKRMFEAAGFSFEEIDLRDYFGKSDELTQRLNDFGVIWCNGGNTFILRRAMKASGLDEILKSWLAKDKVMYGGSSAGSCVCAPSLHGIEHGDRPNSDAVPEDYPIQETLWDGLGLIDFMIVPHCDQEWFKPSADESIQYLRRHNITHEPLNDGQVVIVDGDMQETLL